MPKSKHIRKGVTRPRGPKPVPQAPPTINMAALFERMYESKVLEINQLRAQLAGMQVTLAAALIEAGYGLDGLVIGPTTLERLSAVAGISSTEDEEGNPQLSVIWVEEDDDAESV